jgi:hypothetical protein
MRTFLAVAGVVGHRWNSLSRTLAIFLTAAPVGAPYSSISGRWLGVRVLITAVVAVVVQVVLFE